MEHSVAFTGYKYDTHSFVLPFVCPLFFSYNNSRSLAHSLAFAHSVPLTFNIIYNITGGDLQAYKCGPVCGNNVFNHCFHWHPQTDFTDGNVQNVMSNFKFKIRFGSAHCIASQRIQSQRRTSRMHSCSTELLCYRCWILMLISRIAL